MDTRIALCEKVKFQIFFAKCLRVLEGIYTDAHCQGERQTELPHFLSSSPHNGWAPTLSNAQGICSIYVMHVTIMHITCSETGLKHSPYNSMGEHLPSAMHRTGDMLNTCNACYLHAYYMLCNGIKTQSLQFSGWAPTLSNGQRMYSIYVTCGYISHVWILWN